MPTAPSIDTSPQSAAGAWELPEELQQLRDTVRRFVREQVVPREEALPHDSPGLPHEELAALQERAQALGLWALQVPEEFGGPGLNVLGQVVVAEEAARCRLGAQFPAAGAFAGNPPSVMYSASEELFERYARPLIDGSPGRPYTAMSEAGGGSDPAGAIRCRAVRDGDHYVINGEKMWTTHAGDADWGVVYVRTGEQFDRKGISCLLVVRDTPGLTMSRIGTINAHSPFVLHFEEVRVPVENLIGEEGQGFALATEFLIHNRIVYAAGPIGIAQEALELTIDWVKQRETFGRPLADRQAVQWTIADCEMELRAARLLTYQAAWKADLGQDCAVDAAIAKLQGTETAFSVVDRCIQLFGGLGVSQALPLERWFRELRVKRIGEGATDIMRLVVARELLRRA